MKTTTAIKQIKALGFEAFHHDGGTDVVQVTDEDGSYPFDYYGEGASLLAEHCREEGLPIPKSCEPGIPTIDSKLTEWAAKNGLFWEWENAGCIGAYKI